MALPRLPFSGSAQSRVRRGTLAVSFVGRDMNNSSALYSLKGKRVWVAGHRGMVGSALLRRLAKEDCTLLTVGREVVDLTQQQQVTAWMKQTRPQAIFLAAARVGGIVANDSSPVEFLYENLAIAANVIHAAADMSCEKLLFLGSSCIYPKLAPQPIAEASLLTGPLEPTNEWYAIAKIAGLKLCQAYRRQQWVRLHFGDADQPLRTGGQFRPDLEPRHPGAHAKGA